MREIHVSQTIMASFGSTSLYTYSGDYTLPIKDVIRRLRNCKYKPAGNEPFWDLGIQEVLIEASYIVTAPRTRDYLCPTDEFAMVYLVPTHDNQTLLQVFNVPLSKAANAYYALEFNTWRLVYEEVIPESLSPYQIHPVPVAPSYLKLTGALL